jgi:hypothetical protein
MGAAIYDGAGHQTDRTNRRYALAQRGVSFDANVSLTSECYTTLIVNSSCDAQVRLIKEPIGLCRVHSFFLDMHQPAASSNESTGAAEHRLLLSFCVCSSLYERAVTADNVR